MMTANNEINGGNLDALDTLTRKQLHNRRHRLTKLIHDKATKPADKKKMKVEVRAIDKLKTAITSQLRKERISFNTKKKAISASKSCYYGVYSGHVVGPYGSHSSALKAQEKLVLKINREKENFDKNEQK